MQVYYADLVYNDYDRDFIGVFSTTEKAQAACHADLAYYSDDVPDASLEWEAWGDSVQATDYRGYTYIVMIIEVDTIVKQYAASE